MSTEFFIREKEPTQYKQWCIGERSNSDFKHDIWFMYDKEEMVQFPNKEMLIEFLRTQCKYDIVDEYGRKYTSKEMIEIIKEK